MQILDPPPKRSIEFPIVLGCTLAAALSACAGCLGLVVVILATRFLGPQPGRGAAAGVTLGIVGMTLFQAPVVTGTSAAACLGTIFAAWLCAEFTRVRNSGTPPRAASMQPSFDMPGGQIREYDPPDRVDSETWREILDRVPACVGVVNSTGQLLYVNTVGISALGRPAEAIIGDQWQDFIHPDDADETRARWKRCIAARETVDIQVRMLQHDNRYRWQHIVAEPFFDERGKVSNWYLVGVEIEDGVKAQQALKQSEREARELLERLPGRFSTRTEEDFDYVNREILNETGTTLEKMQQLGFLAFVHPDDRECIHEAYLRSRTMKQAHEGTYRWAQADGSYRWHQSRSVPYFNDDGSVYKWYATTIDIDDLYRSKEVIREREAQLNWITEAVPSLLWSTDADGRLEYVNKRVESYTGRTLSEFREFGWVDLLHPVDAPFVVDVWNESLKTGTPFDVVFRFRGSDGLYRWFQSKASPTRNPDGKIVNWFGLSTDIHERKLVEEKLQREELKLRRLVDAMPAMIWRATPTGKIDCWNRRMTAFVGKASDDVDEPELLDLLPAHDRERVRRGWMNAVHVGRYFEETFQIVRSDGTLHWYLVRGEPFRDETGQILNWYGVCTDIDELKRAEAALAQREHQLKEITETMPCQLWCTDAAGQPTYINRRTAEYASVTVDALRDLGYRNNIHPDDWPALVEKFSRSIQTGEPYQHIARVRRNDGAYRWHQHAAEPMRDADGAIVQWYGISIDIDEPKRAEDRLRQVQTELSRATRIATVAELSASIAHELNQPLTSIMAHAQACRRWLAATPANLAEARASVAKVIADAHSADETMRSIRALFKRQSLERRNRIVPDMVQEAVRLVGAAENRRNAEIEFDFEDALPSVFVDQIQIQQVLINLISNGIEASEHTGRTPHIRIAARRLDSARVGIDIVDNGSGIAEGEKIFDPFFTTKKKGMGIGLAVSRSIIEAHEGDLAASNNPDTGATFSVILPAATAEVDSRFM
jgi:PAS domain S-box-containing protein